jgi:hypothetical protein
MHTVAVPSPDVSSGVLAPARVSGVDVGRPVRANVPACDVGRSGQWLDAGSAAWFSGR